jgi:MGT family glycosyltransferase
MIDWEQGADVNQENVTNFQEQIEKIFNDIDNGMEDVKTQEKNLYEEIKAQEPDYIVYDYIDAFWGKMLAQKLGAPAIASIPSFALYDKFIEKDPTGVIKFALRMSPHEPPFSDHTVDLKELIDFISYRISQTYNIKGFNLLNYGNSELLNIVYTSRYFQPHGELFGENFLFIGSSIGAREETVHFPWEKLDKKPVIYISLGTILTRQEDFYQKCFEAFKNSAEQVVLSVGDRVDLNRLGPIPGNFIVRRFVPQLEILKRAGLFITHGGMNSVTEGICFNVPLIVLPQMGDQFAVAHRVRELGAGISFEHSHITAHQLKQSARELYCSENIRQNCTKIKESFDCAGGVKRAVDEIFKLKEKFTKGVKP